MTENLGGFGCYKENGGALSLPGYEKIVKGGEGSAGFNQSSRGQAETMARQCGLDLTEEQINLYIALRDFMRSADDQQIFIETLILTNNQEGIDKVKNFYKNIFG